MYYTWPSLLVDHSVGFKLTSLVKYGAELLSLPLLTSNVPQLVLIAENTVILLPNFPDTIPNIARPKTQAAFPARFPVEPQPYYRCTTP